MTLEEFQDEYQGKAVDFDHFYGVQCMDLIEFYNRDVVLAPRLFGHAFQLAKNPQPDYYFYSKNTDDYIPPAGAIAVWNRSLGQGYGHAAIVFDANLMEFWSLDQNWEGVQKAQGIKHTYDNVDCFLIPRRQTDEGRLINFMSELKALFNKYNLSL